MYKGWLSYRQAKSNKQKVKITGIQFNKLEFLSEWNKSSIRIYPKNEKSNDSGGGKIPEVYSAPAMAIPVILATLPSVFCPKNPTTKSSTQTRAQIYPLP